jgi:hypothetical protein
MLWVDHLLLRDFDPYGLVSMNMCFIIVAMVMLLRGVGSNRIIFMIMCVYYLDIPVILTSNLVVILQYAGTFIYNFTA